MQATEAHGNTDLHMPLSKKSKSSQPRRTADTSKVSVSIIPYHCVSKILIKIEPFMYDMFNQEGYVVDNNVYIWPHKVKYLFLIQVLFKN